ncbi:arylamine N-acetyltransferase [Haladaptatus sp. T7]|uniref:arylamine N-acetyltransferase family protein n=1 Tax=Haladaptatus sp. T7 TaxID=2029368 RepID=UPI0021A25380|nr:arylamine N-acetyltransferase [Haladaptatus sp. T7]GKZ13956.1 acetyltransferase [Haladaptatus sp. T7]
MNHERYCARIGLDPSSVRDADLETLARLQRAHVTTVPFENVAITGDPFGNREGAGVSLAADDCYDKIVENRRGGFCFELNGLFGDLLAELGFDVSRRAAMMLSDGEARPPANHLTNVVTLDRPYVVDVGMGVPTMRRPLPLDGDTTRDGIGVEWRTVESDRPDSDYATQFRDSPAENPEWKTRYVFRDVPRERSYFEATCEYLASAPESPFTGDPVVTIATDSGHAKLTTDALTRHENGEERERSLAEAEWYDALETEFGVTDRPEATRPKR